MKHNLFSKKMPVGWMILLVILLTADALTGCTRRSEIPDSVITVENIPLYEENIEEVKVGEVTAPKEEPIPEEKVICVHICGAVVSPGVYESASQSSWYGAAEKRVLQKYLNKWKNQTLLSELQRLRRKLLQVAITNVVFGGDKKDRIRALHRWNYIARTQKLLENQGDEVNDKLKIANNLENGEFKIVFHSRKTEAPYHKPKKIVVEKVDEKLIENMENEELLKYEDNED